MHDIIKKGLQFSLGAYAKTRKEIEGAVKELVKKNHLSKKEGGKLVDEAVAQSKKIETKIAAQVRQSLLAAIKQLKVATRKDLDLLEKKLKDRNLRYKRELCLGDSSNIVDFLVEDKVLLELKTTRSLTRDYYRQLQNYLQQARIELGLLVNFSDKALRPRRILRLDLHSQQFVDSNNSDIRT